MFLTLDDDLFAAIDELVTALLREVLVRQEGLGTIESFTSTISVLLRDPVGETVL